MRLYIYSISHIFLLCLSIGIFLSNCYVHLPAVICFVTSSNWLLCRAFCLTSKQINQNLSHENRTLLVLFFPSLPPSLCTSLQQTLGKQVDATFAAYSKTEVGVSPSVQGSANCKPSHGLLCSSFHRWTMSLLIFLVGPMGYLLSPRIGLLLVVALPELSVPILLSSSGQSQTLPLPSI